MMFSGILVSLQKLSHPSHFSILPTWFFILTVNTHKATRQRVFNKVNGSSDTAIASAQFYVPDM